MYFYKYFIAVNTLCTHTLLTVSSNNIPVICYLHCLGGTNCLWMFIGDPLWLMNPRLSLAPIFVSDILALRLFVMYPSLTGVFAFVFIIIIMLCVWCIFSCVSDADKSLSFTINYCLSPSCVKCLAWSLNKDIIFQLLCSEG